MQEEVFVPESIRTWVADRLRDVGEASAADDAEIGDWRECEPGSWIAGETVIEQMSEIDPESLRKFSVITEDGCVYELSRDVSVEVPLSVLMGDLLT
jgi:hypothetical protein